MGRHKLLLVDDSVAVQRVVQLTFADEGFEVEIAGDGAEALDKLKEYKPDVILLDVTMPGLSGYEVCRRIRQDENHQKTLILLLVGIFEPFDEKEARRIGADDVLTKPFQSIRDVINKIGARITGRPETEEEPLSINSAAAARKRPLEVEARAAMPAPQSEVVVVTAAAEEEEPVIEVKPPLKFDDNSSMHSLAASTESIVVEEKSEQMESPMPFAPEEGFQPNSRPTTTAARPFYAAGASDDSLLDLGEIDASSASAPTVSDHDDVILDLGDDPVFAPAAWHSQHAQPAAAVIAPPPHAATPHEARATTTTTIDQMSPELIDAIARRVVEHLSTKILEEVAWEVVPQLAELMIKRQLESKNFQQT